MAEVLFSDGTNIDYNGRFGETKNGVWIPKEYKWFSFGTNGVHLKFENASDLGNDSSGNNNDFTATGLATIKCLIVQQMESGVNMSSSGNFATINPLSCQDGNLHSLVTAQHLSNTNTKFNVTNGSSGTYTIATPPSWRKMVL